MLARIRTRGEPYSGTPFLVWRQWPLRVTPAGTRGGQERGRHCSPLALFGFSQDGKTPVKVPKFHNFNKYHQGRPSMAPNRQGSPTFYEVWRHPPSMASPDFPASREPTPADPAAADAHMGSDMNSPRSADKTTTEIRASVDDGGLQRPALSHQVHFPPPHNRYVTVLPFPPTVPSTAHPSLAACSRSRCVPPVCPSHGRSKSSQPVRAGCSSLRRRRCWSLPASVARQ